MKHEITGSIYDRIKFYIDLTGFLPEDFEVEERTAGSGELRFAPGAMEGILGHHGLGTGMGSDKGQSLADTIRGYLELAPEEALDDFESRLAVDGKLVSARRNICKAILDNRKMYSAPALFRLARYFAVNGYKAESVKLGLTLLTLFDTGDKKEVRDVLRILGCCEEFTDYVLTAAESWPEEACQELYFELAKKLHGWGKITAVERMEADTEEKKEWLLCHGCKNSIMNAYLGHVCAVKCDLRMRLEQGNLTEEEFCGVLEIMEGLLDEGPCAGLSALEDGVELVLAFLEECRKHLMSVDLLVLVATISEYFDEEDAQDEDGGAGDDMADVSGNAYVNGGAKVLARVDELLEDIRLYEFVAENMEKYTHQCLRIARAFGMDVSEQLIGLMDGDFSGYYQFCYYLFEKDAFVEEFFRICEREIRESDYPCEMGDSWGFGERERRGILLDVIVQHLGKYPLRGKKMIRICMHSPITRWRNMAGRALLGWAEKLGATLEEIAPDLHAVVEDVAALECNEGTKETWRKLL